MIINHTFSKYVRWALIIVPVLAIVVGAYSLTGNLPFDYYPYFWDGGNLLIDVADSTFLNSGGETGYALRKFGYTAPIHYAVRWLGFPGVLLINLFWYAVILGAGAVVLLRRGHRVAALVFLSGVICLPFVHKYAGLANPTIQSMGLWFLFFLSLERKRTPFIRATVWPGILFSALLLTDFPKWPLVAIPAVLAVEFLHPLLLGNPLRRETIMLGVKRTLCILAWGAVGFCAAALVNENYLFNNITRVMIVDSVIIEGIRLGLSTNFLIQLWVLGGFWTLAFVLGFWKCAAPAELRRQPGLVMAVTVIAVFSLILWPRSARMFAMTVPFLVYVFAQMVESVWRQPFQGVRTIVPKLAALAVVLVIAVRAPSAGECFQLPTGVREVNAHIRSDPRIAPDSPVGIYLRPVFAASVPASCSWEFLGSMFSDKMDWAVTGEFIDDVIIDEQVYNGWKSLEWRRTRARILDMVMEQPVIAEFPNDFYASKWYIVESNYDDSHLAFMLRRAAEIKNPKWRIHYMGGLFGRSGP